MVNSNDAQIVQLIKHGGEFEVHADMDAFRQKLEEADIVCLSADCGRARNRSAVFRAVVKGVDYPEFFGSSFEGLYDCLIDTIAEQRVGMALLFQDLHSLDPDLEKDMPMLLEVLNEAAESARDSGKVFLFGIQYGGKHPDAIPGVVNVWSDVAE